MKVAGKRDSRDCSPFVTVIQSDACEEDVRSEESRCAWWPLVRSVVNWIAFNEEVAGEKWIHVKRMCGAKNLVVCGLFSGVEIVRMSALKFYLEADCFNLNGILRSRNSTALVTALNDGFKGGGVERFNVGMC
jgi:hypothetical protein